MNLSMLKSAGVSLGMNLMKDKFFLDTNIFIYSFDESSEKKKKKSQQLINDALSTGKGIISFQVIQEFLNVSTRKFAVPLKMIDAKTYLEQILAPLCEIYSTEELYLYSLDIQENTQYSFYDSMIIASAIKAGCKTLYSEDLQDGRSLGGLVIKNPF